MGFVDATDGGYAILGAGFKAPTVDFPNQRPKAVGGNDILWVSTFAEWELVQVAAVLLRSAPAQNERNVGWSDVLYARMAVTTTGPLVLADLELATVSESDDIGFEVPAGEYNVRIATRSHEYVTQLRLQLPGLEDMEQHLLEFWP